jgi:hypothetical protein
MNTITAPAGRHVHVDLDVDRRQKFHYRSQGRDGRRLILHPGDMITFTCGDDFAIRFGAATPFAESVLYSRHQFIMCRVRDDAADGVYGYTVDVVKDEGLVTDPPGGSGSEQCPELLIERHEF